MTIFAEIFQDGQWHKVGKEFTSWWPELGEQLTDRVCDEPNNFFLLTVLGQNIDFMGGYNIPIIGYQSGYPDDISAEVADAFQGKRTFHITLSNLMNYNWDNVICKKGYISDWQYDRLKNKGIKPVHIFPLSHANNDADKHITPFQMDLMMGNIDLNRQSKYYVLYEYDHTTIKEQCKFFFDHSLPKLFKLIPKGGITDDVRIIYSFGR